MPIEFFGDTDGSKYRAAYFERFDGMWAHGDFAEHTDHGGFVIYGRADATLNPGGVRIGTAEIYRQVEARFLRFSSRSQLGNQSTMMSVVLFCVTRRGLNSTMNYDNKSKCKSGTTQLLATCQGDCPGS